jgi:hypothetical protein
MAVLISALERPQQQFALSLFYHAMMAHDGQEDSPVIVLDTSSWHTNKGCYPSSFLMLPNRRWTSGTCHSSEHTSAFQDQDK